MARELKRNKTKLEKLMMEAWIETEKGKVFANDEQKIIINAIKEMLKFFDMEDYLEGSNHVKIITKIYLSAKYGKKTSKGKKKIIVKTRIGIAEELFVGESTLERYTNKYIKCFEKNLHNLSI